MTEQTWQQDSGRKCARGAARAEAPDEHSDLESAVEERQRLARTTSEAPPSVDADAGLRRKPALVRSKTFDHSLLTQVQTEAECKIDRKKSHYSQLSKSNCQYHKIFKEISKDEQLRQSYTCALQKDILYQGRMFVSDHWICFHSKVFGKDTKIAIPVASVIHIKKTKTALLLPNALGVATANDRYVFVSFLSRDNTYKFLMSVCLHLEEKSPCNSPIPSSSDKHFFRGQMSPHTPRFPSRFPSDLGDLGGPARQRQQEMEESSSSDYEKMAEFPAPSFLEMLKHTEAAAAAAVPPQHLELHKHKQQKADTKQQLAGCRPGGDVVIDGRTLKPVSLHTLLFVYMLLVCVLVVSSCYLAFKVMCLEQRLTSLSSLNQQPSDFLQGASDVNTDVFSELLSINLLKLEKVQRNLQQLLDEAA